MTAVALFTFKELLRRRLVAVAAVLTLAFLGLYVTGVQALAATPSGELFGGLAPVLMGLYLASPLASLLPVLTTAGVVSAEIESGAVQSVLARPVTRTQVLLGRFSACAALIVLYTLLLQGAVLALAAAGGAHVPHVAEVMALLCLEPLVLASLGLLGSTLLPTVANGAALVLLYGMSTVGGVLEQAGAISGSARLYDVGVTTSLLIPSDAMYRKAAAVAAQGAPGQLLWRFIGPIGGTLSTPSGAMVVYAVLYAAAAVALGAWVFSRRDV